MGVAGLCALYQMLHLFLTPILWAVLIGTVLFPLKRSISSVLSGESTSFGMELSLLRLAEPSGPAEHTSSAGRHPAAVGLGQLRGRPGLRPGLRVSAQLLRTVFRGKGHLYLAAYLVIKLLSLGGTFVWLISGVGVGYSYVDSVLSFLTLNSVRLLITLYAVIYAAWIFVHDYESLHAKKKFARSLSLPIW